MIIEIPDDVFIKASRSEDEVKKDVIAFLYQKRVLTLEQAAVLAGVTRLDFQRLLAERNIPIHYDVADLEMDLRHVADIKRQ
jgi:predicted HTH domain antitoxin